MKITKKLFIESILAIQKQRELDSKCTDAFRTILKNDHVSGYDNSILVDQMVKVLENLTGAFKCPITGSYIEYFIWELDCGSRYRKGMLKDKEGKNIRLKTPEDLWKLLILESK